MISIPITTTTPTTVPLEAGRYHLVADVAMRIEADFGDEFEGAGILFRETHPAPTGTLIQAGREWLLGSSRRARLTIRAESDAGTATLSKLAPLEAA